jgi:histidine ammonia-lyase
MNSIELIIGTAAVTSAVWVSFVIGARRAVNQARAEADSWLDAWKGLNKAFQNTAAELREHEDAEAGRRAQRIAASAKAAANRRAERGVRVAKTLADMPSIGRRSDRNWRLPE